tara:strand:+ start:2571 stop:3032 length:462 start_codon:yes stop_codon:yes gene_type:complete
MILYIITWTIIYFILILLLHNLYLFFQKNLTTTKTKDYYTFPNKEYNKINDILNTNIIKSDNNIQNNIQNNTSKLDLESKFNTFSNIDNTLNSNNQYNEDAKIFPNYDINLTNKKIETNLEKNDNFDINKFNSHFDNNAMKGELEEFLNKLSN